jgi:hypothetical protein
VIVAVDYIAEIYPWKNLNAYTLETLGENEIE